MVLFALVAYAVTGILAGALGFFLLFLRLERDSTCGHSDELFYTHGYLPGVPGHLHLVVGRVFLWPLLLPLDLLVHMLWWFTPNWRLWWYRYN